MLQSAVVRAKMSSGVAAAAAEKEELEKVVVVAAAVVEAAAVVLATEKHQTLKAAAVVVVRCYCSRVEFVAAVEAVVVGNVMNCWTFVAAVEFVVVVVVAAAARLAASFLDEKRMMTLKVAVAYPDAELFPAAVDMAGCPSCRDSLNSRVDAVAAAYDRDGPAASCPDVVVEHQGVACAGAFVDDRRIRTCPDDAFGRDWAFFDPGPSYPDAGDQV